GIRDFDVTGVQTCALPISTGHPDPHPPERGTDTGPTHAQRPPAPRRGYGPSMPTPDHDALRERYRIERDKRIRPDGNDQYLQPTGRYAHLLDDPYTTPDERDPVRVDVDVAIIGGGFAGLCVGARLRERGVQDLRIIEGGGDVGGAWYWNRYPGAMCDTAAMIYLPLLEETGY